MAENVSPQEQLLAIITTCLHLEGAAMNFYRLLAASEKQGELRSVWGSMAGDEALHISYWKELQNLVQENRIKNFFDDPAAVLGALDSLKEQINHMPERPEELSVDEAFRQAFRLEFVLMSPVFSAFFHLFREETEGKSPEVNYSSHIGRLVEGLRQAGVHSPVYSMAGDMLQRLWESYQLNAQRLAEINSLRNILPVCMHCKRVRNEEGNWDRVERYIEQHTGAQSSHGICPVCLKEHYGDLMED